MWQTAFVEYIPLSQKKNTYVQYTKLYWSNSEGEEFGDKIKDIARSWNDGGKEDGLYHSSESVD